MTQQAHTRHADPSTSVRAAASVSGLTETQERIVDILTRRGELTRDGLIAAWRNDFPLDKATDQSIRSRLAEIMKESRVVVLGEAINERGRAVQIVGLPTPELTLFPFDSDRRVT